MEGEGIEKNNYEEEEGEGERRGKKDKRVRTANEENKYLVKNSHKLRRRQQQKKTPYTFYSSIVQSTTRNMCLNIFLQNSPPEVHKYPTTT